MGRIDTRRSQHCLNPQGVGTSSFQKNHRTPMNARAIGPSKINASRINVSLSLRRCRGFMMGTSMRGKDTPWIL